MSVVKQKINNFQQKKLTVGQIISLSAGIGGITSIVALLRSVASGAAFSFLGVSGVFGLGGAALLGGVVGVSVAIAVPLISFGVKKLIGWIRQKREQRKYRQELRRQYLQNSGVMTSVVTNAKDVNAKDWRNLINIKNFKVNPSRKYTFAKVNCALLDEKGKKNQEAICLVSRKPVLIETITKDAQGKQIITKVKKYKILNPFKKTPNNFTYVTQEELEKFGKENKINPLEFIDESSKSLNEKIIQKRFIRDIVPAQSNDTVFKEMVENKNLNPNFNKAQASVKTPEKSSSKPQMQSLPEPSEKQMKTQGDEMEKFMKSLSKEQRDQLASISPEVLSKMHKSIKTR